MAQPQFEIKPPSTLSIILGLAVLILFLFGLFKIASWGYSLLYYASPILLIATLIINHKVVLGYSSWLGQLFRAQPLLGIGMAAATIFLFPLVALGLFIRAFLPWRMRKVMEQHQYQDTVQPQIGEYVEYEEVKEEKIELPKRKSKPKETLNEYEQLFGDE